DFQHIPYKGTGPALNDLLGGQVSMAFTDVLTAMPFIKSGKVRALGVTTRARSQALPEVPTVAEQGVPGFDVSVFFGVVAPAGALAGIRVVDLSRILGGPYCGQILGDHGADVLKIEPPQGDDTRTWGPPFKDGVASYYFGLNRNKRVMRLDLGAASDREVLLA